MYSSSRGSSQVIAQVTIACGRQRVPVAIARLATACNACKLQCNVLKFQDVAEKSQQHLHAIVDSQDMVKHSDHAVKQCHQYDLRRVQQILFLKHSIPSWLMMYLDVQYTN